MNSKTGQSDQGQFDILVDKVCTLIQAGEDVDLERLANENPEYAQQLRELYPALAAMATLDNPTQQVHSDGLEIGHDQFQTLGDFQIVRQIGRGGMGIVYEAQQITIRRSVAVKILPLAALIDPRALQRFKNEVMAVATLEHPHIVSVYSIGEERGIHYFAMQLIRGQSLAAVIWELRERAHRKESVTGQSLSEVVAGMSDDLDPSSVGEPPPTTICQNEPNIGGIDTQARGQSNTLASQVTDRTYFKNVAQLIIQACDALQHAHEKGIVHRDIKPGNLLLDANGNLFVTDFGLARIETAPGITMTGDVLGTLRYISPEQVLAGRMVIDHRTDIYSLGATLYELLTLNPFWSDTNKADLVRRISLEEPIAPQKLNSAIPADLETIVLKAISKDPNDRYINIRAMGEDLQNFLDHKPIEAKRPSVVQWATKWARRNPAIMWSAVFVLTLLTVGSLIASGLILSANVEAQRQTVRADDNLDQILSTVDNFLWRVGESGLEDLPGAEQLRRELLLDAMGIFNSLIDSENQDPRIRLRSIEARSSLGSIQSQLGEDELAGPTLELAISEFEKWLAEYPNHTAADKARQNMAGTYVNLGGHYSNRAQYKQAAEMYDLGLALEKNLRADDQHVDGSRTRFLRTLAYGNYSVALTGLNKDRAACEACENAITELEELINDEPDNAMYRVHLGWAHSKLASSHKNLSQRDEAIKHFDHAISIFRKWSDASSNKAWSKSNLGSTAKDYALLVADEDRDKATALIEESQSVFTELHSQFPDYPEYQASLADCYLHLGGLNRLLGKYPESNEILEKSIALRRDLVHRFPDRPDYRSELAKTLMDYSAMLDLVNQKPRSDAAHAEGIQIVEQLVEENPHVPDYRFSLVKGYYNTGLHLGRQEQRPAAAEKVLEKAASICDALVVEFPDVLVYQSQLSDIFNSRGNCLAMLDKEQDALEQYEKAMALVRQLLVRDPTNRSYQEKLLGRQINLAAAQSNLSQVENALQTFQDALPQYKKRIEQEPENPLNKSNYANCLANVAYTYRDSNQFELTADYLEQALEVVSQLQIDYPKPFVRQAIANYTEDLLKAYAEIDEREKLAALLNSAQKDADQFLEQLNSNELLFKKLIDVSSLFGRLGKLENSQALLNHCLEAGKRDFGEEHELTLKAANRLGLVQRNSGNNRPAQETFQQIIDIRTKIHQDQPENALNILMLGGAHCNLGNANSALNRDAIENYSSAIELLESLEEHKEDRDAFLLNSFQGRAGARRNAGEYELASNDYRKVLTYATSSLKNAEFHLMLAMCYHKLGKYAEAIQANLKAAKHNQVAPIANYNLACAYALNNQKDEALESLDRTVGLGFGSVQEFEQDSDLESLRGDDRYAEILAKLEIRKQEN